MNALLRRRAAAFVILTSSALGGCFAIFSLDEYGPPSGASDATTDGSPPDTDAESADVAIDRRPTGKMVFVTSLSFDRDKENGQAFRSLSTAHVICQALARDAGLSGDFRAWMSDEQTSPARSFAALQPPASDAGDADDPAGPQLINPAYEVVAPSYAALLDGGPLVPLVVTERGTKLAETAAMTNGNACPDGGLVWTGTSRHGTDQNDNQQRLANCSNWEATGEGNQAVMGLLRRHPAQWTAACEQVCSGAGHLYCFEQ